VPLKRADAEPPEFVATTVKSYAPVAPGVPVIKPVFTSMESPAGTVSVRVKVGAGKPSAETDADTGVPTEIVPSAADTAVGLAGVGSAALALDGTTSEATDAKTRPQTTREACERADLAEATELRPAPRSCESQIFLIRDQPSRAEVG
jgi:hypothetical protein